MDVVAYFVVLLVVVTLCCVADVQSSTEHRKMAASLLRIGRLGCVKVNTLRLKLARPRGDEHSNTERL